MCTALLCVPSKFRSIRSFIPLQVLKIKQKTFSLLKGNKTLRNIYFKIVLNKKLLKMPV